VTSTQPETIVSIFRTPEQARDAIQALQQAGFAHDDISVLTPDRSDVAENRPAVAEQHAEEASKATLGATAGGLIGGGIGSLIGLGTLVIPGLGPFLGAGLLASSLVGMAVGAGVGGLAGALSGMGVPREHAGWYEQQLREGGTLVAVQGDGRADEARTLLRQAGGYDYESGQAGAAGRAGAVTSATPSYATERETVAGKATGQVPPVPAEGYDVLRDREQR